MDFELGTSRQRSRIEVLAGPRAGEVLEEIHAMTLWMPETVGGGYRRLAVHRGRDL